MSNLRLLERIRRAEVSPAHRGSVDPQAVVLSVLLHLQRLLNSRQGGAQIADEYGMPDFTNLLGNFSSASVEDLARDIEKVIKRFEPRLAAVRVSPEIPEEVSASLHFRIDGQLVVSAARRVPISIQTSINPEGRVSVKR